MIFHLTATGLIFYWRRFACYAHIMSVRDGTHSTLYPSLDGWIPLSVFLLKILPDVRQVFPVFQTDLGLNNHRT